LTFYIFFQRFIYLLKNVDKRFTAKGNQFLSSLNRTVAEEIHTCTQFIY